MPNFQQIGRLMRTGQMKYRDAQARKRRRSRAKQKKKNARKMLDRDDIGTDTARRFKEQLREADETLSEMDRRQFHRRMSSIDPYYEDREDTEMDMWVEDDGVRSEVVPS